MERSYFRTVKDAFAADLDISLAALGVEPVKGGNTQWKAIRCPCCTDTDGSCSIARATGHINCKQCSRKLDLFEWWRDAHGSADDWEAAKAVGEKLGVKFEKQTGKKKRGTTARMTPAILDQAIENLCELEDAEWARQHFKQRGLWEPKILARFGVGFLDGVIVFAQFHPDGALREKFRKYMPNNKVKWGWSRLGDGAPIGFWPAVPEIPKNASVLLCEGEMDTLTAYIKLGLQNRSEPIAAFTWTGGAGSPLVSALMPKTWPERTVYVCYDNDTFQGPDLGTARAPNRKKLQEMARRQRTMLTGVVGKLVANKCHVKLLHVDIDPIDHFGADLRDWADSGKSFDDLPCCNAADVIDPDETPIECTHDQVLESAGELVHFQATVTSIENFAVSVPITSTIVCPMGSKNCCRDCPVPRIFSEQTIDWSEHRKHLLRALMDKRPTAYMIRHVVGKPAACNECDIEHDQTVPGSHWRAGSEAEDDTGMTMIDVISMERPSLSGSIGITGYAHHTEKSVGVLAIKLEQLDKPDVDLETFHQDLLQMTPWNSNDKDTIDRYIETVVADYSQNITKIYGRPELHIGTLLVAHSALWYELEGQRFRGWLDVCFFGGTRLGKSATVKNLFRFWRLGEAFTCMDNFSRAGLTVGGAENGSKMKPGLWPKNNRKMLFLDEFHHMEAGNQNVMVHLQSARDEGKVSALKVYGDLKLPAAVRLIVAGNWAKRMRSSFQFACQHLQALYGVPESLSRMDFAWCVDEQVKMEKCEVPHLWTSDLSRALILRAWSMEPHQIHIDPELVDLAKKTAVEWDSLYAAEDLPLHTGLEKFHSIIRIAIAIANKCYSHPQGKEAECLVRQAHVEWAIAWLVHCWANVQYDEFSERRISARTLTQPWQVEAALTIQLDLADADHAAVILSRLTEANTPRSLQALIIGSGAIEEPRHYSRWLQSMMRMGAIFEKSENQFHTNYLPTEGALKILHGLINLARDNPEAYGQRVSALQRWANSPESMTRDNSMFAADPDLSPFGDQEDEYGVPF